MTEITWATKELVDRCNGWLLLSGIVPYECIATKTEGVWESRHYHPLGELIRHEYERELFTVVEYGTSYDYNSDQYTYIRFRLPDAPTPPIEVPAIETAPRSYLYVATASGHHNSKEVLVRASDRTEAVERGQKAMALKHSGVEVERVYTWREVQQIIASLMATPPQE